MRGPDRGPKGNTMTTTIVTLAHRFGMEEYAVRSALDEQTRARDEAFSEAEAAEAAEILSILAEQHDAEHAE